MLLGTKAYSGCCKSSASPGTPLRPGSTTTPCPVKTPPVSPFINASKSTIGLSTHTGPKGSQSAMTATLPSVTVNV